MITKDVVVMGLQSVAGGKVLEIVLKRDSRYDYINATFWLPVELVRDWQIGDRFTLTLQPTLNESELTVPDMVAL